MSLWERVRPYLPALVTRLPVDLSLLVLLLGITIAAVSLPVVRTTPLRAIVSIPFLLFAPGYAFVSAVFPEAPESDRETNMIPRRPLTNLERLVFSLGSSVAIVPLVGFTLNFTPWGLRLGPMLVTLALFTVVCVSVAAKRRSDLPPERRFVLPVSEWYRVIRNDFLSRETRTDKVLNVALAVVVLFAATSVGYALVAQQDEQYSELYLLTGSTDDSLSADGYPQELTATESRALTVGIGNHEGKQTTYTVVTKLQRVRDEGDEIAVVEEERLDEFEVTLEAGESTHQIRVLEPQLVGDRLRLLFLLYRGDPPAEPRTETAYRRTHLWVNVSAPGREPGS